MCTGKRQFHGQLWVALGQVDWPSCQITRLTYQLCMKKNWVRKNKRQEEKDKWYDSISLMQMSMDVLFGDLLNSMSKETDWEQTL